MKIAPDLSTFPPEYATLLEELAGLTSTGITKVLQSGPDNLIEKLQVTNPDASIDVVSIRRFPQRTSVSEICIEHFANATAEISTGPEEKQVFELIRDATGALTEVKKYHVRSVK